MYSVDVAQYGGRTKPGRDTGFQEQPPEHTYRENFNLNLSTLLRFHHFIFLYRKLNPKIRILVHRRGVRTLLRTTT